MSCHRIQVKVKLPHNLWSQHPGGLLVAIRFVTGTPDDSLGLVVYRDSQRIAHSTAQVATAQSVVIPSASNGVYDVYVVDAIAFGNPQPSPVINYEGLAQVVYNPAATPLRDLLPDPWRSRRRTSRSDRHLTSLTIRCRRARPAT